MTSDADYAADELADRLSCSQCGQRFNERACGPTHAAISFNFRSHRLIQPFIIEAVQPFQEILDDLERAGVDPAPYSMEATLIDRIRGAIESQAIL